jgi:hypothetical protein
MSKAAARAGETAGLDAREAFTVASMREGGGVEKEIVPLYEPSL